MTLRAAKRANMVLDILKENKIIDQLFVLRKVRHLCLLFVGV